MEKRETNGYETHSVLLCFQNIFSFLEYDTSSIERDEVFLLLKILS